MPRASFILSDLLKRRLAHRSWRLRLSTSKTVRRAIEEWLDQQDKEDGLVMAQAAQTAYWQAQCQKCVNDPPCKGATCQRAEQARADVLTPNQSNNAAMLRAAALALLIALPAYAGDYSAIDGDTIRHGSEKIRVMGVDAPETVQAKCPSEREAGLRAKAFTAAALERGVVTLERHGSDKYGRTLAVVRVDGRDLAVLLIEAGHGRPYHGERRRPWC